MHAVTAFFLQPVGGRGKRAVQIVAGKKSAVGIDLMDIAGENDSVACQKTLIQTDVFIICVIEIAESTLGQVQRCMIVNAKKSIHAAAVIIMSVGKHGIIGCVKRYTKRCSILHKSICLAHIKEDSAFFCFDKKAQAVFAKISRGQAGIFGKNRNFNAKPPEKKQDDVQKQYTTNQLKEKGAIR